MSLLKRQLWITTIHIQDSCWRRPIFKGCWGWLLKMAIKHGWSGWVDIAMVHCRGTLACVGKACICGAVCVPLLAHKSRCTFRFACEPCISAWGPNLCIVALCISAFWGLHFAFCRMALVGGRCSSPYALCTAGRWLLEGWDWLLFEGWWLCFFCSGARWVRQDKTGDCRLVISGLPDSGCRRRLDLHLHHYHHHLHCHHSH